MRRNTFGFAVRHRLTKVVKFMGLGAALAIPGCQSSPEARVETPVAPAKTESAASSPTPVPQKPTPAEQPIIQKTFTIQDSQQLFAQLKTAKWDLLKPLNWDYFFIDHKRSNLEALSTELAKQRYVVDQVTAFEDGAFGLKASKREVHTVETSFKHNLELTKLAKRFSVASYDGPGAAP